MGRYHFYLGGKTKGIKNIIPIRKDISVTFTCPACGETHEDTVEENARYYKFVCGKCGSTNNVALVHSGKYVKCYCQKVEEVTGED